MRRALLLLLIFVLLAPSIVFAASDVPADVIVHFRNADGWDVIAQNGGQVAPHFFIKIYVKNKAEVTVNVEVNGKQVFNKRQIIDFMKEYDLRVEEKGSLKITVNLEIRNADGSITTYNIIRQYTIAQTPIAIAPENIVFSPKQFQRLVEEIKLQTVGIAAGFAIAGVAIAVLVRSVFLLIEPFNTINLIILGGGAAIAFGIDEQIGVFYWVAMIMSNFIAYKYLKTANLTRFLRFEWNEQNIVDTEVPIYQHEGKLAVAFQDAWSAIRRVFKNQHVYLDVKGDNIKVWRLDGGEPVYLITSAKREGDKYVIEPMDIHSQEFIKNIKYFEEIKRQYKKLLEDYTRLKAGFPLAVRDLLNKITPDVTAISEFIKPNGGEQK